MRFVYSVSGAAPVQQKNAGAIAVNFSLHGVGLNNPPTGSLKCPPGICRVASPPTLKAWSGLSTAIPQPAAAYQKTITNFKMQLIVRVYRFSCKFLMSGIYCLLQPNSCARDGAACLSSFLFVPEGKQKKRVARARWQGRPASLWPNLDMRPKNLLKLNDSFNHA